MLQEKWAPILDHDSCPKIGDRYRRQATAIVLENQHDYLHQLNEAGEPANVTGGVQRWDPVLISLVRRALPNLIAFDVAGVQPMTGPTGLIFALRSRYTTQAGTEALFNEADTDFTGTGTHSGTDPLSSIATAATRYGNATLSNTTGQADTTANKEGNITPEMAFSVEKVTVTAKTRALKAEYSTELAQDFRAIHGLDAETELANILSAEILAEINREFIRTINATALQGAQSGTSTAGVFDLDVDSNGRWSVEKFKGLLFQLEREANQVAKATRRGKGNIVICGSDVASALSMAGVLDHTPALNTNLNVDDTGNTFVGTLHGRTKVYIDPYFSSAAGTEYATVGYKGPTPYDAGIFYCPYVPLQMVRAVGENNFQPKIAFKTRYGIATNPFVSSSPDPTNNTNSYYRIIRVDNLM